MKAIEAVTNLHTDDVGRAREFFGFLGLTEETMNQGWVARFSSPDSAACVQVVTRDATAAEDSAMTIKVDDVDAAYAEAQRRGYEIVHPVTDEPWGIRRFFARSPDGHVINVAQYNGGVKQHGPVGSVGYPLQITFAMTSDGDDMSFQAYLDNIEEKTGLTPRQFIARAQEKGFDDPATKSGVIVDWLKADFDLGRGHAMALVHVIKNGAKIDAKHVGTGATHNDDSDTLWLDGRVSKR